MEAVCARGAQRLCEVRRCGPARLHFSSTLYCASSAPRSCVAARAIQHTTRHMTVRYHWKGNSFKFKNKSMDLVFCLPGNKKSKQIQMVKKLHFILSAINNLKPSVTLPSPDDSFHAFSHGRINVTTVS
ncbi:hypothetical protein SFRURICE_009058 [Spodoptera frugiperda]|nr:hypothetical protein SFRURICE_009058 [Spodoptera frugiperda]